MIVIPLSVFESIEYLPVIYYRPECWQQRVSIKEMCWRNVAEIWKLQCQSTIRHFIGLQ